MKINLDQIEAVCRKYEGCDPSYFVGDVPISKSSDVRRRQNISEGEPIVALVDFPPVWGSGGFSLVITDRGLGWERGGKDPERLSWEDLINSHLRQDRLIGITRVHLNEQLSIVGLRGNLARKGDETILLLLKELQDLARRVKENKPAWPEAAEMAPTNLEQCEFCEALIKPDVTFCKYCGIKLKG